MRTPVARAVFTAVCLLLVISGCSSSAAETTADPTGVTSSSADGGRLADLDLVDAKAYQGPSSARLADAAIHPIADHPKATLPATVTDMQGTEVTITNTDRILALDLYGSLSRIVFELGLGDQLVGRDTSSAYAEAEHLPLVTVNGHELQAEAILALDPTVVITDTSLGPWDVILQLRDVGIPVVVVDSHRNMDNISSLIGEVADALGVPDIGKQLGDRVEKEVAAKVDEIAEIAPKRVQDKLRTVFLYVRGQAGIYYMFGQGSGADAMIEAVGGYDVTAEIDWTGMKPVTDEGLIAAQPDLILMMTKGLESVDGVDGLLERLPAVGLTPAGKNKRIVDMPDTEILSFGPRTADVLDALARAIYAPPAAGS